jgi:transposase
MRLPMRRDVGRIDGTAGPARELTKLGHPARLMLAKDVKPYVKRNKNDAADAEAICEAVRRPMT